MVIKHLLCKYICKKCNIKKPKTGSCRLIEKKTYEAMMERFRISWTAKVDAQSGECDEASGVVAG